MSKRQPIHWQSLREYLFDCDGHNPRADDPDYYLALMREYRSGGIADWWFFNPKETPDGAPYWDFWARRYRDDPGDVGPHASDVEWSGYPGTDPILPKSMQAMAGSGHRRPETMKSHYVRTKSGERIRLASNDSATLAILPEWEETTPEFLRGAFSRRSLLAIARQYPAHSSERAKVARALGDDRAEMIGLHPLPIPRRRAGARRA